MVGGKIGTEIAEEYTNKEHGRGTYTPIWEEIENQSLLKVDIKPAVIARKV